MINKKNNLKLGMNSNKTLFNELILIPSLTSSVPKINIFILDSIEIHLFILLNKLNGHHRHALSDSYSEKAILMIDEFCISDDFSSL